jgi:hypothetical protein
MISAVPEAETNAMMLAGLGLMGSWHDGMPDRLVVECDCGFLWKPLSYGHDSTRAGPQFRLRLKPLSL